MAITNEPGTQMPGSDDEQFNYGLDLNGLWQGQPPTGGYPGIGGSENGLDVSGGSVENQEFNHDGSLLFNDSLDDREFEGMDSMAGVAGLENISPEFLEQESMYSSQESLPFDFPLPETASPLIESSSNKLSNDSD